LRGYVDRRFCREGNRCVCIPVARVVLRNGYLEVSLEEGSNALNVRVQTGEPRSLFFIVEQVRAMFDLNADWATIERTLGADPALAARIRADPGLRVPGCWNGFELATRAILGQQIGAARAAALAGRMVQAFGPPFCWQDPPAAGADTSRGATSSHVTCARVGLLPVRPPYSRAEVSYPCRTMPLASVLPAPGTARCAAPDRGTLTGRRAPSRAAFCVRV
jgi:hypothetical protein